MVQLVKALRYKPEGRGFDSSTMALESTQPLTEYFLGRKAGRCVGLTTLPPSCADCPEILEPQPPGTLTACLGIALSLIFD